VSNRKVSESRFTKRPMQVHVTFASKPGVVETPEGRVVAGLGDALMTGLAGESWPIARERFERTYLPVPPTQMGEEGWYVKKPVIVEAMQTDRAEHVPLAGGRGSLRADAGDWIIQDPDGERWVVSDAIFRATYAPEE
jgi:hypothetical protein